MDFSRLHHAIFNRPVFWSAVCRGCVRGNIQSDNGLYCDVIFLGGAGCQIFTSQPFFLAPPICKSNSIFCRQNKLTCDFVPHFRHLENRSLSHFRNRLVASPVCLLPAGIFQQPCYFHLAIFSIGPEKPHWRIGQFNQIKSFISIRLHFHKASKVTALGIFGFTSLFIAVTAGF